MKKIILADAKGEVIKFLARGQRHTATAVELVIDSKGVIAQDADAALALERFGSNIVVEDIDVKAVAKEVVEAVVAEVTPEVTAPEVVVPAKKGKSK